MNLARGISSGGTRSRTRRWPSATAGIALLVAQSITPAGAVSLLLSADAARTTGPSAPLLSAAVRVGESAPSTPSPARVETWRLPLAFEPADDRAPRGADQMARGPGYSIFVGRGGALLALRSRATAAGSKTDAPDPAAHRQRLSADRESDRYQLVRMRFEGAQDGAPVRAEDPLAGHIHRLLGADPARWQTGLQPHAQLRYPHVYPGIDVVFHGSGRELEYDFVISPGAKPDAARVRFDGVDSTKVDNLGQLNLDTGRGVLVQRRPVAYQDGPGGRTFVDVAYRQHSDGSIGFVVGSYDANRPLVIDPVLSYATFVGGIGFDQCWDLAVDATGAVFVTGETESESYTGFSVLATNAFQTNYHGGTAAVGGDAFVGKLLPDGTAFEWFTFLGGSDLESAFSIALSPLGEPVIGGFTTSTNFPTTTNAYLREVPGTTNRFTQRRPLVGFVARLTPDGSGLVSSTLFGGTGEDEILDVGLLGDGSVAVVGSTTSSNLPVTAAAAQPVYGGETDGFLAVLSADATTLSSCTYLGGSARDTIEGLAVDTTNSLLHVVGITLSTNFPVKSALQSTNAGFADAFAAGFRADASAAYATYLGGTSNDYGYRAAIDPAGGVWFVGESASIDLPVTASPQSTNAGIIDGFAVRLSNDGQTFQFGMYLGGEQADSIWDVAVDAAGVVHFAGESFSSTLTGISTNSLQTNNAGGAEILVATLAADGTLRSSFLGSAGEELAFAVAVDPAGNTYLAGRTRSTELPPGTTNVAQPVFGGGTADGFVARIAEAPTLTAAIVADGVRVSWAAPNPDFVLESAPAAAAAGGEWSTEATPARFQAGRHVVDLPLTATNRVFRLRWAR